MQIYWHIKLQYDQQRHTAVKPGLQTTTNKNEEDRLEKMWERKVIRRIFFIRKGTMNSGREEEMRISKGWENNNHELCETTATKIVWTCTENEVDEAAKAGDEN